MEIDVKHSKQRNKRRERAQRMQAERDKDADGVGVIVDGDSADEDSKKPIQRPPQRRKKANIFKEPSPILEEDVVDGFAILSFKTYEDLEYAIKLANKRNEKRLSAITELTTIMLEEKLPKIDTGQIKQEATDNGDSRDREREWNYKNNNHHITHSTNNITFNHDPGTSDDSGRASERLTTSSVAQRDQDSSRDRLSDASSRCSSGKGYICDSEGDDDKASDGGSTASTAVVPRKSVENFPTTGLPLSNGPMGLGGSLSLSPVPSNSSGSALLPAPSPAAAALPPPSLPPPYTTAAPLQVTNEPLNTLLTSLPNHVGSVQNNGQQPSTTATIPNGKSSAAQTAANKIPSTCTSTSTSVSSPNSKQSMVSSPAAQSPGSVANSSKKHSPTISNLLAPTTSTITTSSASSSNNGLPAPISISNVTAVPSPVSSTSSLSSISMPSRLGSSTPPVLPVSTSSSSSHSNTQITTTSASINPSVPVVNTSIAQSLPHSGIDTNSQSIPVTSNAPTPILASPASLALQQPSLNGPSGMPPLMGLGGLGPLGHPLAPPYRSMYPGYSPLYSPYGLHPYGLPPSAIPSPALSPRTADSRRDSPLVLSKPVRPVTPNSSNNVPLTPQSSSNTTTTGPNSFISSVPGGSNNSPRSYSPSTRERDNFSVSSLSAKSSASTPGSSVIPFNNAGPQPPSLTGQSPTSGNTSSLLTPYNTALGASMVSSANTYPISSLAYPKTTSLVPPPSAWPPISSASSLPASSIQGSSLNRPTPPAQTAPGVPYGSSPLFTAPLPPPAVPTTVSSAPHPFSAESLLTNKPDQTDLLRRELDNRFLDRSGLNPPQISISTAGPQSSPAQGLVTSSATTPGGQTQTQSTPPGSSASGQSPNVPFLRQELHHHQHQHTHLHQHQHQHQSLIPAAPSASLFPPPLFKDIPKIGAVDSPFYRTGPALVGMPPYPYPNGYPGLSGPTQFVPPSHLPSFVPKQQGPPAVVDPTKPKQVKTGRWNAMHVRIAWEIYHHQAKQNPEKASSAGGVKPESMLRPNMYPPPPSPSVRPHDLPPTPQGFPNVGPGMPGRPFDPMSANFLTSQANHLGVSPFGRYASPFASPFGGLSPYARELQLGGPLHDPWRNLSRVGAYPPPPSPMSGWSLKPDPEVARREAEERERQLRERDERERQRREREEKLKREQQEREEKLRKEQQEREQRERERERKEKERREMERREMERERMLQQQRLNESSKAIRDRSPLRNGDSDIRIKEEPRKEEAEMMMRAADQRYHQSIAWQMAGRHPAHMLPPHLSRAGMLPQGMVGIPHYAPTGPPGWPSPLDHYRDYRFDPMLRSYPMTNPMLDAMRVEEAKAYAAASAHYRNKDPSPIPQQGHPPPVPSPHHRMPPGQLKPPSGGPQPGQPSSVGMLPNDMHKKEDGSR